MTVHRSLTLAKFVSVISHDVLQRYFARLNLVNKPEGWETLNGEALEAFLGRPENADADSIIREDFRRINDVSETAMGVVFRAYEKYNIPYPADRTAEENAFRLFLDYPKAFAFTWSRYLLFQSGSRLSVHLIERREFTVEEHGLKEFEAGVRKWYEEQGKGSHVQITPYEDQGEDILLIRRGNYMKALTHWNDEGDDIDVSPLRIATEDVVVYERDTGLLKIKTPFPRDRLEYVRLFAACIVGEEGVAESAVNSEVFTLTPIQDGTFRFEGAGPVIRVELKSARIKLYGLTNPTIQIRASDVLAALKYDLGSLGLDAGVLLSVGMKFHILRPGTKKVVPRAFTITPPSHTNLPDRIDNDVILQFLRDQGIKLR